MAVLTKKLEIYRKFFLLIPIEAIATMKISKMLHKNIVARDGY